MFGLGCGRAKQGFEAGVTRLDGMPEAIDAYDVGIFLHELEAMQGKDEGKESELWDICDQEIVSKTDEKLTDWEKL